MSPNDVMRVDPVKIVDHILPVLLPKLPRIIVQNGTSATSGGGDGATSFSELTGTIDDLQAPQFLKTDGTRALTGDLAVGTGVTIDGVDISSHVQDPDAHHARATVSGPLTITGQLIGLSYADGLFVDGLTTLKVKREGNSGLTIGASLGLALGTPSMVGVSSTNSVTTTTHNHAVDFTTAAQPNKILALDVNARAYAAIHEATTRVRTPVLDSSGDLSVEPGDDLYLQPVSDIYIDPGSNIAWVQNTATVKSTDYFSQTTGWGITGAGAADFRYIYADEMHVKAFIADLEQALAGGQIISKSVAVLAWSFTAPAAGVAANLVVEDLPSAPNMQVFQAGDVIRLRQFSRSGGSLSVTDCWGTVHGYIDGDDPLVNAPGCQYWTFTRSTGSNAGAMAAGTVIEPGAIVLDYGTSGNGYYEVNAIDGLYAVNSPYLQFVRWTGHPATGKQVRVRLGQLRGVFGVDEFGMYVGTGATDADTYLRLSDYPAGNSMNNIPFRLTSGGNTTILMQPAQGISIYSAATEGDNATQVNFYNRTDGVKTGYISAPHDTNYLYVTATRGLLVLKSTHPTAGSTQITLNGQGPGTITATGNTFRAVATNSAIPATKTFEVTPTNVTVDGNTVWTTAHFTSPLYEGGSFNSISLTSLTTPTIRSNVGVTFLNVAGSDYASIAAGSFQATGGSGAYWATSRNGVGHSWAMYNDSGTLRFYANAADRMTIADGGTVTAAAFVATSSMYTLGLTVAGGGVYSDTNFSFLTSVGQAQRIATGGVLASGSYSDLWKVPQYGLYTSGGIAVATSDGLTSGYVLDVGFPARFRSSAAFNAHVNLSQIGAPAASGVTGILYVNGSGQLRYIRPGGGDYYIAG